MCSIWRFAKYASQAQKLLHLLEDVGFVDAHLSLPVCLCLYVWWVGWCVGVYIYVCMCTYVHVCVVYVMRVLMG